MNIRKTLVTVSLVAMIGAVLMLIMAIFGFPTFSSYGLATLLSLATIAVAAGFAINGYNLLSKNRPIAIFALVLLGVISILGFINYWTLFSMPALFGQITAVVAIATAFFNIIASFYIKLGKNLFAIQMVTYALIIATDIILTLLIFGVAVFDLPGMIQFFGVICLCDLGFLSALSILSKRNHGEVITKGEYVKLPKSEYDALLAKIADLENELKKQKENDINN